MTSLTNLVLGPSPQKPADLGNDSSSTFILNHMWAAWPCSKHHKRYKEITGEYETAVQVYQRAMRAYREAQAEIKSLEAAAMRFKDALVIFPTGYALLDHLATLKTNTIIYKNYGERIIGEADNYIKLLISKGKANDLPNCIKATIEFLESKKCEQDKLKWIKTRLDEAASVPN